ncbi:MAG: hypothetical protein M1610_07155 [Nitrospirae bacterium]|nr:hypothetical protein [Nitrospirota bacterium]
MSEILKTKEWLGEFFSSTYEKRFSGKIIYSPENGIILEYTIVGYDVPDGSDIVFGVLENGRKCTLIGRFDPTLSRMRYQKGFTTRSGRNGFEFLVIGDFLQENSLFKEVVFSFTNLHEFFSPKGFKDSIKFTGKPLIETILSYGKLTVGNTANFISVSSDISSHIYSENEMAMEDLQKCFKEIEKRHPNSFFMLKKDIDYYINLTLDLETDIKTLHKYILDITNLFSILIYNPVSPEDIEIHTGEKENRNNLEVYPSLFIDKRTLEIATKELSHFHMPITHSKIELSKTIKEWSTISNDFSAIVSSLQTETGFRSEHLIHSDIVLYATQLESISYIDGVKNHEKYEWPINTYGSEKLKSVLAKIFAKENSNTIGQNIGDLRNEIAHIGKPKKLLRKLSLRDMIIICQCLQLVIIAYILNRIGIEEAISKEYQDKFTEFEI